MDALAALTAVQTGDLRGLLGALDPDEREDWILPETPFSQGGTITLARFGAIQVGIQVNGDVAVAAHTSVDDAIACHAAKVKLLNLATRELQAMVDNPLVDILARYEDYDGPMVV